MAEKEYIEREALSQAILDLPPKMDEQGYGWLGRCGVWQMVNDFPAADVRPVVTCGKCKYGKYTGTEWFCDKHSGHADKFGEDASYHEYHSKYWFCADGEERKHE